MKSDSRAATHHKSPRNMPGNQPKAVERLLLKGHKHDPQRFFWSHSNSKLQKEGAAGGGGNWRLRISSPVITFRVMMKLI